MFKYLGPRGLHIYVVSEPWHYLPPWPAPVKLLSPSVRVLRSILMPQVTKQKIQIETQFFIWRHRQLPDCQQWLTVSTGTQHNIVVQIGDIQMVRKAVAPPKKVGLGAEGVLELEGANLFVSMWKEIIKHTFSTSWERDPKHKLIRLEEGNHIVANMVFKSCTSLGIISYMRHYAYFALLILILFSTPRRSRGCSTKTSMIHYLIKSAMICENISMAPPRPNGCRWCFQSWNRLCYNFLVDSNSQSASKSNYWLKSYGDFAEWVDFAYW